MRTSKYIYMIITADMLELPRYSGTLQEVADAYGMRKGDVCKRAKQSTIKKNPPYKGTKIVRIPIN